MRNLIDSIRASVSRDRAALRRVAALRADFARMHDDDLRLAAKRAKDLLEFVALTAVVASRLLGQDMFDVQLRGALAMVRGSIAEMQTGEGKTLAAVPAVAWFARDRQGVHVLTVNDYLARRDALWMGPVYRFLGFSIGYVNQSMSAPERRAAYACDITYATANEVGFDLLRDRLALRLEDQVHRPFAAALIDEADSILIDEARVPLVIAGGSERDDGAAIAANHVVRTFREGLHYTVDTGAQNVALTDHGIRAVEHAYGCDNLFDPANLGLHTAVQDALHAHALLHRDVDYLVKDGAIEMVDEFKGRIAQDRRWPAGLHTAVEAKEGVIAKSQGMILGSTTLQHLVALYPRVCGMTGTAATQSLEFRTVYGLRVETIPTNRPVVRVDHPDVLFADRTAKELAVVDEIRRVHATGRPVLVGTASVAESEGLSRMLDGIPHQVLNARHDEQEAAIIARAGARGAVTISTNMAGRGTDIQLGDGVAALGGLHVIGTNRHESRRIDNQLRGRAGRQGDPGSSRFFVSLEDDLISRYGDLDPRNSRDPQTIQRLVEGRHLDTRLFLHSYDVPLEGQRHQVHTFRQQVLEDLASRSALERLATLRAIDDAWADYLARVAGFREGVHWLSWGRRDPHYEYLKQIHVWFTELQAALPEQIEQRIAAARLPGARDPGERGAVWTYLTTDQPFGTWTERVLRGLRRKIKSRSLWSLSLDDSSPSSRGPV